MSRGTRASRWEQALRRALDAVDHALEDRFGDLLPLHPSRPPRRATANPKYDGLFAVDSKFSLGLVSRSGPGYVIDVRLASTATPTASQREAILAAAEEALQEELPKVFPGRVLQVTRVRTTGLRITGDLSL